jgi:hypothetical protein
MAGKEIEILFGLIIILVYDCENPVAISQNKRGPKTGVRAAS